MTLFNRLKIALQSTHIIFAISALIFGVLFIKIVPPLWGIDESTHFARVYQLSEGGVFAKRLSDGHNFGSQLPTNLTKLNYYVAKDIADNPPAEYFYKKKQINSNDQYKQLTAASFNSDKEEYNFSGATVYSPFSYVGSLPSLVIARLLHLSIGHSIFLARLGTLLVYIGLVSLALFMLRDSKLKWLVFVIALFPESVFQASIVNVDSLAIGISLLLFTTLFRLFTLKRKQSPKLLLVLLAVLAISLPLTKAPYFALALPLILLPSSMWRSKKQAWVYKAGVLGAAVLLLLIWTALTKDAAKAIMLYTGPDGALVNPASQAKYILLHPFGAAASIFGTTFLLGEVWINNFFGILGWNYVALPMQVIVALLFSLTIAMLHARDSIISIKNRTLAVVLAGVGIVTILGIILTFYLSYTRVGTAVINGVQGRYFLPTAIFILSGAVYFLPVKFRMSEKSAHLLFPVISVICLAISVGVYYSVLF